MLLRLAVGVAVGLLVGAFVQHKGRKPASPRSRPVISAAGAGRCQFCSESMPPDASVCHSCGSVVGGRA